MKENSELWQTTLASLRLVGGIAFALLGAFTLFRFAQAPDAVIGMRFVFNAVACFIFLTGSKAGDVDAGSLTIIICVLHAAAPLGLGRGAFLSPIPIPGVILVILGLSFSALSLVDLGSSFGILPANRGLVASGMYRIVRHPVYFGYLVTAIGWLVWQPGVLNVIFVCVFGLLTCVRIHLEETTLGRDTGYRNYQAQVRYSLVRGVY